MKKGIVEVITESRLQIYALGNLRILKDGKPIRNLRSRKAQALLVYLASTPGFQARDVLADMFWGDMDQQRAMANLRDSLHVLRNCAGEDLAINRQTVGLQSGTQIWTDMETLDQAVSAARAREGIVTAEIARKLQPAVDLYRGDLLQGFFLRHAPGFEEWLAVERERYRQAYLDSLLDLARYHAHSGRYRAGLPYVRRMLQLEPLMDIGHELLMLFLAGSGQRGAAIAHYADYRRLMQAEPDLEPAANIQELYARLVRGDELTELRQPSAPSNLPSALASLIGRDEQLSDIAALLSQPMTRLVTLTGVGGIGKTRLAVQAAHGLLEKFPDGVWHVELAALHEPELVPEAVGAVVGVSAQEVVAGRTLVDVLTDYFVEKRLLLVLDNCEHLIGSCTALTERLLGKCAQMKILATSRESLGLPGEIIFQVPSLPYPTQDEPEENPEQYPAVELLAERARAVAPGFRLTDANTRAIVQICRQLDGIPLAIELAAAKVRVLTPVEISERLQERFRLLVDGPRGALPRHRTLEATMEWSYRLLGEVEQRTLRRLAVFAGGWTLEAAEAVTLLPQERTGSSSMLSLHASLVDKSLIVVEEKIGQARYRLLETVREYGTARLAEAGETQSIARRHAEFFTRLAEQGDPQLRTGRQLEWLHVLDSEHDNIRVALDWSILNTDSDLVYRLVAAMGWFWFMRGNWGESSQWLGKALRLPEAGDAALRARAVYRAGGLQLIRGNLKGNRELVESALQACRKANDREGIAWCLNLLGQAHTWGSKFETEGDSILSESLAAFEELRDAWGRAWTLRYLGQTADLAGNYEKGKRQQLQALEMFEELGDEWNAAHSLYLLGGSETRHHAPDEARLYFEQSLLRCSPIEDKVMAAHALRGLGEVALKRNDLDRSETLLTEALDVLRRIGDENCSATASRGLGEIARRGGDFGKAARHLHESLVGYKRLGYEKAAVYVVGLLGILAADLGRAEQAVRLLAAVEAYFTNATTSPEAELLERVKEIMARSESILPGSDFERIRTEGASMTPEDAVNYALTETVPA